MDSSSLQLPKLGPPLFFAFLAFVLAGVLLPFFLGSYHDFLVGVFTVIFVYITIAQMWNISAGYGGVFSFGSSAFIGIGAYATTLLSGPVNPMLAILIGGVMAASYAAALGIPTFRLGIIGFSIATYGGATILSGIITYASHGSNLFYIQPYSWNTLDFTYYALFGVAVLSIVVSLLIRDSRFGLRLKAIREDEDAAKTLRINTTLNKAAVFMISAFITAIAGGFYSMYLREVQPANVFSTSINLQAVLQPILGGIGTISGPLIGSLIVMTLDQYTNLTISSLREFILGGFLMIVVVAIPGGILSLIPKRSSKKSRSQGEEKH